MVTVALRQGYKVPSYFRERIASESLVLICRQHNGGACFKALMLRHWLDEGPSEELTKELIEALQNAGDSIIDEHLYRIGVGACCSNSELDALRLSLDSANILVTLNAANLIFESGGRDRILADAFKRIVRDKKLFANPTYIRKLAKIDFRFAKDDQWLQELEEEYALLARTPIFSRAGYILYDGNETLSALRELRSYWSN